MIVGCFGKYFVRAIHKAVFRRNGTNIDIHFEQDGEKKWISIPASEIDKIRKLKKHGEEMYGLVEFDEKLK